MLFRSTTRRHIRNSEVSCESKGKRKTVLKSRSTTPQHLMQKERQTSNLYLVCSQNREKRSGPAEVTDALAEEGAEIFENAKAGEASAVGEIPIAIVRQTSRNLLERNADQTTRAGEADPGEDEAADAKITVTEGAADIAAEIDKFRTTTRGSTKTKRSSMTMTTPPNETDAEATMRMDSPDPSASTRRSSSTTRCRNHLGFR